MGKVQIIVSKIIANQRQETKYWLKLEYFVETNGIKRRYFLKHTWLKSNWKIQILDILEYSDFGCIGLLIIYYFLAQ